MSATHPEPQDDLPEVPTTGHPALDDVLAAVRLDGSPAEHHDALAAALDAVQRVLNADAPR